MPPERKLPSSFVNRHRHQRAAMKPQPPTSIYYGENTNTPVVVHSFSSILINHRSIQNSTALERGVVMAGATSAGGIGPRNQDTEYVSSLADREI